MPIYEFMCKDCKQVVEVFFKIEDCPNSITCSVCAASSPKVLSACYPKTDTPLWLNDHVRDVLQKEGEPPIETRKQHDEYLRKNNLVQLG